MKGKRIITIYYVIVLTLGITSLILIRPEKPVEPAHKFVIKYKGNKFEATKEVRFISLENYFEVDLRDYETIGFMLIDTKSSFTLKEFFITVTDKAKEIGSNYIQLFNVKRYNVSHGYGWYIGNIGTSNTVIEKRYTFYFRCLKKKEVPKWPSE